MAHGRGSQVPYNTNNYCKLGFVHGQQQNACSDTPGKESRFVEYLILSFSLCNPAERTYAATVSIHSRTLFKASFKDGNCIWKLCSEPEANLFLKLQTISVNTQEARETVKTQSRIGNGKWIWSLKKKNKKKNQDWFYAQKQHRFFFRIYSSVRHKIIQLHLVTDWVKSESIITICIVRLQYRCNYRSVLRQIFSIVKIISGEHKYLCFGEKLCSKAWNFRDKVCVS